MTTPFPRQMAVTLPTDERGYLGRECPAEECLGYFLIRPGTGLTGAELPCHCPYCGLVGPMTRFHTPEQIEYAKSVVVRQFAEHALQRLKQHEFNRPAKGAFGIGISLTVKPGRPLPISHYRERTLETAVTCSTCTLEYAVYGVFGFCPDCGVHNSLQILALNLDLTRRQVALASTLDDAPLRRHLLEDALENCVSALDGFGRESIRVRAQQSNDPPRCAAVSFQNLGKAAVLVTTLFGVDLIDQRNSLPYGADAVSEPGPSLDLLEEQTPTADVYIGSVRLTCAVCKHTRFRHRKAQLQTALASFFNVEWTAPSADCYICTQCGFVHWFMPS